MLSIPYFKRILLPRNEKNIRNPPQPGQFPDIPLGIFFTFQPAYPVLDFLCGCPGIKALPFLPGARLGRRGQVLAAVRQRGHGARGERNHRFARKVVLLHESVDDVRRLPPPNGVPHQDAFVLFQSATSPLYAGRRDGSACSLLTRLPLSL